MNLPIQTPRGTYVVDAVWTELRRCVEINDPDGHSRIASAHLDKERADGLHEAEYGLLWVNAHEMKANPDRIVAMVARHLGL